MQNLNATQQKRLAQLYKQKANLELSGNRGTQEWWEVADTIADLELNL